jgi:RimJ/RimL family protein N-acetyltransferase
MIQGTKIRLRHWRSEDLTTLVVLRNDAALQAQVLARARGSSLEQVEEWLVDRNSNELARLFIIATIDRDQAIGYVQFMGIDPIDRCATLGICLARNAHGMGYGTEAIALGLAHLKASEDLRKCILQVRADNEHAIHCYLGLGFERCGMFHKHIYLEEDWRDVVLMEWIAE